MIFIFFHYSWFTVFCQFSTAQHDDPVTYTFFFNEPFHRKETHGLGEQTWGCQGGGGVGWTGNLGLIDANYCLWNG